MSPRLSPGQTTVVAGLARGESYDEIAAALGVKPATVKYHRRWAMAALGARSSAHLVALAIGYQLIPAGAALPRTGAPGVTR